MLCHLWKWKEYSGYLSQISEIAQKADVSPIEFADRQSILLLNPGLKGRLRVTHTIRFAISIYNPPRRGARASAFAEREPHDPVQQGRSITTCPARKATPTRKQLPHRPAIRVTCTATGNSSRLSSTISAAWAVTRPRCSTSPGEEVKEMLHGRRKEKGDPHEGIKLEFVNPVTDEAGVQDTGLFSTLLRPGEENRMERGTAGTY